MARRGRSLATEEQIRGVRAAIASPKTPPQLRRALKRRLIALERQEHSGDQGGSPSDRVKRTLLGLLGLQVQP
jgi:hypothetical protein